MAGGEVRAKLVLDKTDFEKGLTEAQDQFAEFAKAVETGLGLGGGIAIGEKLGEAFIEGLKGVPEAILGAVEQVTELSHQLEIMSLKTGIAVESLQELGFAAKLSGTNLDQITSLIDKMEKSIVKGGAAFTALGLSAAELRELAPEAAFQKIADAIQGLPNPIEQTAAAMNIFGKAGAAALPLIKGGMADARLEAEALGTVLTKDTVRASAELKRETEELDLAWQGLKNQFAGFIADSPVLIEVLEGIVRSIGAIAVGIRDHHEELGEFALWLTRIANDSSGAAANLTQMALSAGAAAQYAAIMLPSPGPAPRTPMFGPMDAAQLNLPSADTQTRLLGQGLGAERMAANKAVLEEYADIVRRIHDQAAASKDIWREIGDLNAGLIAQDKERYELQRQMAVSAQDYANAGAKNVGSPEFVAANRQAVIDAKAQLDLTDAQKKSRLEIVQGLMESGTISKELGAELEKHLGLTTTIAEHTKSWEADLREAAALISQMGGAWAHLLGTMAKDIAGFGDELKNLKSSIGKGDILGEISSGIGLATAAFDVGKAIVGLFSSDPVKDAEKEIAKTIGYDVGYQMSKTLMEQAKQTGESLAQVAKEYQAKIVAQQQETNLQTMTSGIDQAKKGAESLLGVMGDLSKEAQAYAGHMVQGVNDAMMAHGLGYLASPALAKDKGYTAVTGAVGATSEILQGMSKAGGIDTDYLKNAGGLAGALEKQAEAAAIKSGMAPADATKAGFATIAPMLTAELNASLQSGKQLDDNTQALIDEAKKNGIAIVADPMIEQVAVSKQILATLQGQAGGPGGAKVIPFPGSHGVPHLQTGGLVTAGGLAHVDTGEMWSGVGSSMSGGMGGGGDIHVHVEGPVFGVEDLNAAIQKGVTEAFRQDRGDLTYWMKRRLGTGQ